MQYFLILSRALFGDVDRRNVAMRDAGGVVGDVPMEAKCGRSWWRRWRNNESGLDSSVKRWRRLS